MHRLQRMGLWLAVAAGLAAAPAHAHKLKVFASAEGATISGYAYFPGGGRAQGLKLVASAPDGRKLAEATTDAKGEFSFLARFRCDHRLAVETVDGHRATFTVEAEELPESLPPLAGVPAKPPVSPQAPGDTPRPATSVGTSHEAIEHAVDRAVSRHIRPLREQLEQAEAKRRLHEILGGIGYIVGVAGIVFFLLGRRRTAGTGQFPPSS